MAGKPISETPLPVHWFAITGLALGAAYGLTEASAAQLLTHWSGSLSWKNGTSLEALLYSPIFYAVAYLVLSLPFLLASRISPRIRWDGVLIGFLVALSGYLLAALMRHWFSVFAGVMIGLGLGAVGVRWYLAQRERRSGLLRRWAPIVLVGILLVGFGAQMWQQLHERRTLAGLPQPGPNAPNVLLLVLDTERADHLTPYGYDRATTPELHQLAQEGVIFNWAVSPAATTLPSHASLLTGRRVFEHSAGVSGRRFLDGRYPTLAEVMGGNGYATAGFVANIYWAARHTGIDRGFIHYEDFYGTTFDGITRTILGHDLAYWLLPKLGFIDIPGRKRAETVNEELLDWVDDLSGKRPFFAMLNYMDVHAPYLPPKGYSGRIRSGGSYKTSRIEIGAWNEHEHLPSAEVLKEWRDRYDESLMYLDHEIGNLLDSLRARGALENTLIIVTADHGESFGEHASIHHGANLYLEQIRVPLLLWGPNLVPQGKVVEHPVDLRGVAPTVVAISGVMNHPFPQASLLSLTDTVANSVQPALSSGPEVKGNPQEWQTGRGWVISLLSGHYHLIALESGKIEVYDVAADREEANDLANQPEGIKVIADLRDELDALMPAGSAPEVGLSEDPN
jgi:arylsulfatase A-like enzyme